MITNITFVLHLYVFTNNDPIFFQVLGSVCAAALHRRHLMVWKIFAPRFVFAAVSSFTIFICTMLTYLIIISIHFAVTKWVKQLDHKKKSWSQNLSSLCQSNMRDHDVMYQKDYIVCKVMLIKVLFWTFFFFYFSSLVD